MGITEVQDLVDNGQPVSPEEIAAADAEHIENAYVDRHTRVELEDTFAKEREAIDAKAAKAIAQAEERRRNAHSKNLEKRNKAYESAGLNPNGSDPRGREQAVL